MLDPITLYAAGGNLLFGLIFGTATMLKYHKHGPSILHDWKPLTTAGAVGGGVPLVSVSLSLAGQIAAIDTVVSIAFWCLGIIAAWVFSWEASIRDVSTKHSKGLDREALKRVESAARDAKRQGSSAFTEVAVAKAVVAEKKAISYEAIEEECSRLRAAVASADARNVRICSAMQLFADSVDEFWKYDVGAHNPLLLPKKNHDAFTDGLLGVLESTCEAVSAVDGAEVLWAACYGWELKKFFDRDDEAFDAHQVCALFSNDLESPPPAKLPIGDSVLLAPAYDSDASVIAYEFPRDRSVYERARQLTPGCRCDDTPYAATRDGQWFSSWTIPIRLPPTDLVNHSLSYAAITIRFASDEPPPRDAEVESLFKLIARVTDGIHAAAAQRDAVANQIAEAHRRPGP